MNLPDSDRKLFIKLHHSLLVYVNNKYKLLENLNHSNSKDLLRKDLEDIEKIKEKLYSDPTRSILLSRRIPRTFPRRSWRSYQTGGTL